MGVIVLNQSSPVDTYTSKGHIVVSKTGSIRLNLRCFRVKRHDVKPFYPTENAIGLGNLSSHLGGRALSRENVLKGHSQRDGVSLPGIRDGVTGTPCPCPQENCEQEKDGR